MQQRITLTPPDSPRPQLFCRTLRRYALPAACLLTAAGAALAQSTTSPAPKESQPYLYDEFSPGEGGTSGIDDLDEIDRPETPID